MMRDGVTLFDWYHDCEGKTHRVLRSWERATCKAFDFSIEKPPSTEHLVWLTIQDAIGPAKDWPQEYRSLMWKWELDYKERFKLVIFLAVNGCDPQFYLHWMQHRSRSISAKKMLSDRAAKDHVLSLVKIIESEDEDDQDKARTWTQDPSEREVAHFTELP